MKRFLLLLVVLATSAICIAHPPQRIDIGGNKNLFRVTDNGFDGLQVEASLSYIDVSAQSTKSGQFVTLSTDILMQTFNPGFPDLPVVTKLIEVPFGANVTIKVVSYREEIIELSAMGISSKIIPAQP